MGLQWDAQEEFVQRWQEHFEAALNHLPSPPSAALDAEAAQATADPNTSIDEPTLYEVKRVILKLENGRAAGSDGIPPELLKSVIGLVCEAQALHALFIKVWRSGRVPADWKDGILIALYTGKDAKTVCGNYRPIILLSIRGKVFANVLLERTQPLIDMTRRPEQSGVVAGRSTVDAILALRLLSDLHREFDRPLTVAFLDIKAAFVDRRALWKALRSRVIPDSLVDLIAALHENTGARVLSARISLTVSRQTKLQNLGAGTQLPVWA